MTSMMLGRSRIVLLTVAVIVALDQITKSWALGLGDCLTTSDCRTVDVIGSLRFRLAFNTGMAFSKGQGRGVLITAIAIVIIGVMVWLARSARSQVTRLAIGLVIGGALGNIIDRLLRDGLPYQPRGFLGGAVVDFIDLQWWPTFNVADAAICVGGVLVALMLGREERLAREATPAAPGSDPAVSDPAGSDPAAAASVDDTPVSLDG